MASPVARGRMILKTISESEGVASLSPQAAVLFMMLIPHYNAYGKQPGGVGIIKDVVVPFIPYLSYENIPEYLEEISDKTNVKWFKCRGHWWLHSIHFNTEHQDLRIDRMGTDDLPDYVPEQSGSSPGVVPDIPYAREGLKVEGLKEEGKPKPQQQHARVREVLERSMLENRERLLQLFPETNIDLGMEKLIVHCRGEPPIDPYDRLIRWLGNEFPAKRKPTEKGGVEGKSKAEQRQEASVEAARETLRLVRERRDGLGQTGDKSHAGTSNNSRYRTTATKAANAVFEVV